MCRKQVTSPASGKTNVRTCVEPCRVSGSGWCHGVGSLGPALEDWQPVTEERCDARSFSGASAWPRDRAGPEGSGSVAQRAEARVESGTRRRSEPGGGEAESRGKKQWPDYSPASGAGGWFVPENVRRSARSEPRSGEKGAGEGAQAGGLRGVHTMASSLFVSPIETGGQGRLA
uniref:Uncharacterized protein n=1 Tax=Molossus molossus TaxID=27622 RepID=A0A7J8HGX3_MOLMO|nr:hypothetical protein HJG59_010938 [Molossus molossus]